MVKSLLQESKEDLTYRTDYLQLGVLMEYTITKAFFTNGNYRNPV
jgi:hypothetical protein